jgi:hypothetical protein
MHSAHARDFAYRKACRVERSLYQRANGYNYEAVKIFMPAGSKQPVVVHCLPTRRSLASIKTGVKHGGEAD